MGGRPEPEGVALARGSVLGLGGAKKCGGNRSAKGRSNGGAGWKDTSKSRPVASKGEPRGSMGAVDSTRRSGGSAGGVDVQGLPAGAGVKTEADSRTIESRSGDTPSSEPEEEDR